MRLDLALDKEAAGLDRQDRAFAQDLTFGVTRLRGRLDHFLGRLVTGGLERLEPEVLRALRLGLYQILYQSVPDYAAVSQSVELARSAGAGRASSLVNGVLRSAIRATDPAPQPATTHQEPAPSGTPGAPTSGTPGVPPPGFPAPATDPLAHLTTWGSHPRWLVERWVDRWGPEAVARLVELDNQVPELYLVPMDGDVAAAAAALAHATPLPLPGVVRVGEASPLEALEAVSGFIQDPGAALVCRYAAPPPGGTVVDVCAAPGGKALSLARTAGYLLAADPAPTRVRLLAENLSRPGIRAGVVRARAEELPLRRWPMAGDAEGLGPRGGRTHPGGAEGTRSISPPGSRQALAGAAVSVAPGLVLVDAPCTGTGTLRRHPDARWRLDPGAPAALAEVQLRILQSAARVVPPGGLLVYSTCTLEPEENEQVVERFLAANPDFEPAPPTEEELRGGSLFAQELTLADLPLTAEGWLQVLPQDTGFDGAFAARLRRRHVREAPTPATGAG